MMSHEVIRGIVRQCSENRFFSIITNESTDISGKQQFSISLRYDAQDFTVHEEFIGLYEVDKADADHLLLDCLCSLGLDVHLLRGQAYDGAAVMAGARNGVATKISELES